jgi:hypothetical protein
VAFSFPAEKCVGDLNHDARAITGIRFRAARSAVREIFQHSQRLADNLIGFSPLDIGNYAHSTSIMLEVGVVQTLFFWKATLAILL